MTQDLNTTIPDKEFFTTGEAAAICAVTPNAVLKWVAAGRLQANRTPGGHHRIPRSALVDLLKGKTPEPTPPSDKQFQYCWEFNARAGRIQEGCRECIVYRSRTGRCYEMANLPSETGHSKLFCDRSCEECKYYEMIRGRTPNILVATDNSEIQSTIESQAQNVDCKLQFTTCEYHCSMLIESFSPDYIVIDCSLGSSRSREFARHLSEDPRIPYARILLAGSPRDIPKECDHLVFGFITRPLTMMAVDELISGLQQEH
jgi:excisionase family DNA binding protein